MTTSAPLTLADMLARLQAIPKPAAKAKASPAKRAASPPDSYDVSFNVHKTGYKIWKALSHIIQVQEQRCANCGTMSPVVKGEFYELANGLAHATWCRAEAYGIEHIEDLPLKYIDLPETVVTACAHCRPCSSPFDPYFEQIFEHHEAQLCFPF
jgi:hypothetical protein